MDPSVNPRLLEWRKDNTSDPDRPSLNDPSVQQLVIEIGSGSQAANLGGVMSLNIRLEPPGLVKADVVPWDLKFGIGVPFPI